MYMQGLHYDLDSLFPENPDFLEEEEICLKDYKYLTHLYPAKLRGIMNVIEEYMDRYEYEGSPIFHEFPDAATVYRMAEDIYEILYNESTGNGESAILDLIRVLVCQDIYVRRRRYSRFCKGRFAS